MKREIAAGLLLLAMLVGSIVNYSYYDSLTAGIESELERSRLAVAAGDFDAAKDACHSAHERWLGAKPYTHVFIRHQEVDSTSDIFYDLIQLLDEEKAEAFDAMYEKLLYHLEGVGGMEHPSFGSVF